MAVHSTGDVWLWGGFWLVVGVALLVDLWSCVRHHDQSPPSLKEALLRTLTWIGLALVFNAGFAGYLFWRDGAGVATQKGLEFLTAWVLEKSLSVDNLFVILLVFQFFRIPRRLQRLVLLWGVIGAILMRFVIIFFGIWVVGKFHQILYLFGAFILWSGFHMLIHKETGEDLSENALIRWMTRHFRMTPDLHEEHFFVWKAGKWWVTPLFMALVSVELSDLIFAIDSIPAVFAVTLDPYIVLSSNILAILGLRALYFLLAHAHEKFSGLQTGVALVLMFTGFKMLAAHWVTVPAGGMLGVILGVLGVAGLVGWIKGRKA